MTAQTWYSHDLPVLAAIVDELDAQAEQFAAGEMVALRSGLPPSDVARSVRRLVGDYVRDVSWDPQWQDEWSCDHPTVLAVTAQARSAVRQWPTAEEAADRVLTAVAERIESAADPADRAQWEQLEAVIVGPRRELLVEALRTVIRDDADAAPADELKVLAEGAADQERATG